MATVQTYDLATIRRNLPALGTVTYMNSGTEGIMAEPVAESYLKVLGEFERFGHYARKQLDGNFALARERFAELVSADPDEICVTRNGTDGCAFVLGAFDFKSGDEILIGNQEHPAILYPAAALQTTAGVKVRQFRFDPDPARTLESFAEQLTPKTRLAAFSHVSCETGIRVPAAEMIKLAHERGARVLLDGAQTVGVFPLDFHALGCDYLTGSAHKWLCGPKGTGLLVVRRDRIGELTPRYVAHGALAEPLPHIGDDLAGFHATFAPAASRFEYGMRSPALYAGLVYAMDYLKAIGWEAIASHERAMSTLLKQRLAEVPGVTVQTPLDWDNSSALVNFKIEGVTGQEVSERFWNDWKIVQRAVREPNGVRLSTAYFSSPDDVNYVVKAVTAIRDAARKDK
jgi:selenocysteine lyase/cysteine desulfurase